MTLHAFSCYLATPDGKRCPQWCGNKTRCPSTYPETAMSLYPEFLFRVALRNRETIAVKAHLAETVDSDLILYRSVPDEIGGEASQDIACEIFAAGTWDRCTLVE